MKSKILVTAAGILTAVILITGTLSSKAADVESFLGRWALTLNNGVGWLEIRDEGRYLDGDILWIGGSVMPLSNVYLDGENLIVERNRVVTLKKDSEGNPIRTKTIVSRIELTVDGDKISGVLKTPQRSGESVKKEEFTGKRIPPLPETPKISKIKYDDPIELFNGKDLSGWEMVNPKSQNGFKAENGILLNNPEQVKGEPHKNFGNLRTVQKFEDFNLKLEVNVPEGSNSGIYLRGIYEVQVFDSYGKPLDSHNMGGLYSRITPSVNAEKPAGEWQSFDITLYKRHLTVILNGTTIIDNQPVLGVTGGALTSDEFSPGPIYLQGDHGKVMYKNLVLTPIRK